MVPGYGGGGGGSYYSDLNNCRVEENYGYNGGGGYGGALKNCLIINNIGGWYGGGAYSADLDNCTVVGNYSADGANGTFGCISRNSIVYYNGLSGIGDNYSYTDVFYDSCTTPAPTYGTRNITSVPKFVDRLNGDYHLQSNSPCLDSGLNTAWMYTTEDLDGNPRIGYGTVDMGCYEIPEPIPDPMSIQCPVDMQVEIDATCGSANDCCSLTQGYWKNHPDAWGLTEVSLGSSTLNQTEALQVLWTPTRGDATYILAHQYIAAQLNAHGTCASDDTDGVQSLLTQAGVWLNNNPLGSKPDGAERDVGIALGASLDDYNNGVIGPGHCSDPLVEVSCAEVPDLTPSIVISNSCGSVTVSQDPIAGTTLSEGESVTVTVTVSNSCGQVETCTLEVSVPGNSLDEDGDGDGANKRDELIAGTDSESADEFLGLTSITETSLGECIVKWPSKVNRRYQIHTKSDVADQFQPTGIFVDATPPLNTHVELVTNNITGFLRISVEP